MLGWIVEQGVRWQPSLGGTLSLGRTNSFFLGGGRAMLNALYLTAEQLGVEILYDAEVVDLEIDDGMFLSADAASRATAAPPSAPRTLVAAAGGFEANIEWLQAILGRGRRQLPDPRHALQSRLDAEDAAREGRRRRSAIRRNVMRSRSTRARRNSTAASSPAIDCVVFGIVVNKHAQRFYDEGEDIWPKRYAIWGRLVAAQPDQIAYIIFDAELAQQFMPSLYPPIEAQQHRASSPPSSDSIRPRWRRRSPISTRRCGPARSTTRSSTIAAPKG